MSIWHESRGWSRPGSRTHHPTGAGHDEALGTAAPLLALVGEWKGFRCAEASPAEVRAFRRHERSGRPLGMERSLPAVEQAFCRTLRRGTPGSKPRRKS